MFDFILAAILAQTTPEPDVSSTPSAMTATAMPATDASPEATPPAGRRGFPYGPRRLPVQTPAMTTGDALVRNSGSTNTAGYAFVVHADATVDIEDGHGGTDRQAIGKPQAKWFFEKLEADMPLSNLGGGHCMKSASFGSRTFVTYKGESSPDLLCPGGPETAELNRTIGIILGELHINPRGSPRMLNRM